MTNWDAREEEGHCTADSDLKDAAKVAQTIGIPFKNVSFVKEYWNDVFCHVLREYEKGRTPNPDILCNKYIKFGYFLDWAVKNEFDYLSTGHYAKKRFSGGEYQLLKGTVCFKCLANDLSKDQTFFLSALTQESLSKIIFPLGELHKSFVKNSARMEGLHTFDREESMGICFIGKRNFKEFLSSYIYTKEGKFVDFYGGKELGLHDGASFYTIGQRARIGGSPKKMVVFKKDLKENIIFLVPAGDSVLYSKEFTASNFHWISQKKPMPSFMADSVIRSTDKVGLPSAITVIAPNSIHVKVFGLGHYAVAPGQSVVLYQKDVCIGSGVIDCFY